MEAAVCSVAQNIAEGSLFETLTLTEIMRRRRLIEDKYVENIKKQAENIDRKLHGLINSLRKRM
jgi:four helix bundle protein